MRSLSLELRRKGWWTMHKTERRVQIGMLLYCLFVSFCFLTICTKSSFLYPLNNGSDIQCFFTVGKGMMHGLVPYRDLVEQKGPLLYFLYGLASLVSSRSFFGVYLLEILSYTFFLFYSYKIVTLFFQPAVSNYFYIAAPLMALVSFVSPSFFHGGETEEYILPLLAFTLYILLRYCREEYPKPMPLSWLVLTGVCAGCVLWMKFSLLGFWFGFMAVVAFALLFTQGLGRAVISCLVFLGGMAATALPWLVYFGAHGALKDLIEVYFYNNIFGYSTPMTMAERMQSIWQVIVRMSERSPWLFGTAVVGIAGMLVFRKLHKNWVGAVGPLLCAVFLTLGLYWGGRSYTYYFFIYAGFTCLAGVVAIHIAAGLYEVVWGKGPKRNSQPGKGMLALAAVLTLVLTGASYQLCANTYLLGVPKEDCVQYKFADIIHEKENATLLNYGFLDAGFYYAADILPVHKYFCLLNIPDENLPEMRAQQRQIVQEKSVDFIVMMLNVNTDVYDLIYPSLFFNYEVAAEQIDTVDNVSQVKFVLFRAKDIE